MRGRRSFLSRRRRRPAPQVQIIDGIDPSLRRRYENFLAANGIGVAGIEFIVDAHGTVYTYDVNTNTNYNPEAEARPAASACAPSRAIWARNSSGSIRR